MDEDVTSKLSQIQTERMELKSSLNEISYLMRVRPHINLSKDIDRILDRLKYLEILEKAIRKRLQ